MQIAPSYIAAFVAVVVNVLALSGVTVGTEDLTTTVQTLITICSGLVVMYRQITEGRSTLGGTKPE